MAVEQLLTVQQAAERLGVSPSTMYGYRWRGIGPRSFRRGGRVLFRANDIDDFLAREREATTRGGA